MKDAMTVVPSPRYAIRGILETVMPGKRFRINCFDW
jgi:hypothetical protein